MNLPDALRAITRRAIPLFYISPAECFLPAPFSGSGSGSSTPATIEILPVTRRAGPTSLELTLESESSVMLTWDAVSYAFSYVVYRATNFDGPFVLVASNVLVAEYVDVGLEPGVYFYKVTGIEPNFGETTPSPTVGITV